MSTILKLELESRCSIKNKKAGLSEPSGLALAPDGSLWTVCDENRRLFRIDFAGQIQESLEIGNRGLEGIAFDAEGQICVVDEDVSKIIVYDCQTGKEILNRRLQDLEGFASIAAHFEEIDGNGLEGITFDTMHNELLLLKEADPGLLIAVSADLERITSVEILDEQKGFTAEGKKMDFSGMCFDAKRDLLWILSEEARCVFTFDRRQSRVVQRHSLKKNQQGRSIRYAEGIAVDKNSERLYVVSDDDAKLTVFRIVEC
ncbi:SdiA-regulated [Gimesia maris]|uniref:SdiA-regulated domain-containing protein n=1 Tax=Gimesia maris TaxID=122 RepID=UPI001189DC7C|nr:SdiA-regulated domain-containing protein [Gimesia maris]QDT81604.1 SdiA-regulated [Gimesia maris]